MRTRVNIDLDAVRGALQAGTPVVIPDIDIASCVIEGQALTFALDRHNDPIQRQNRAGFFYEEPELAAIKEAFPGGGTFVDIGSNVGNHSLYVAAFLDPQKIIPFEPNPLAYKLLIANVVMNGFREQFDLSYIGIGVSDRRATGFGMSKRDQNLGAARMLEDAGEIETITGDEALAQETPNLIKIDVEGMEMLVLRGLQHTISRCAPTLLIEVDRENYTAFDAWIEAHDYEIIDTFQRYQVNKNFVVRKRGAA